MMDRVLFFHLESAQQNKKFTSTRRLFRCYEITKKKIIWTFNRKLLSNGNSLSLFIFSYRNTMNNRKHNAYQ